MFEIFFSEKAKKDFNSLPNKTKRLISEKLLSFQESPSSVRIKKIVNSKTILD